MTWQKPLRSRSQLHQPSDQICPKPSPCAGRSASLGRSKATFTGLRQHPIIIHTYIHTYILTYIHTLHTYITYIHTYIYILYIYGHIYIYIYANKNAYGICDITLDHYVITSHYNTLHHITSHYITLQHITWSISLHCTPLHYSVTTVHYTTLHWLI